LGIEHNNHLPLKSMIVTDRWDDLFSSNCFRFNLRTRSLNLGVNNQMTYHESKDR
jgi:hypothetical protein